MYLQGFCKVVTSVGRPPGTGERVYLHEFCKVVTSEYGALEHIVGIM